MNFEKATKPQLVSIRANVYETLQKYYFNMI